MLFLIIFKISSARCETVIDLIDKGHELYNQKKYNEAIVFYNRALELNPDSIDALYYKGLALNKKGEYEEALLSLEKVLKLNISHIDALNNMGLVLTFQGKYEEAYNYYNKSAGINPQNTETYIKKGFTMSVEGKYKEAIECYDRALEINPEESEALVDKGFVLVLSDNFEAAFKCFDRALEINPGDMWALNNKGLAFYEEGKYVEALNTFDKILEIDPTYAYAWKNKGDILYFLTDYDEAFRCYDKSSTFDPYYTKRVLNSTGLSLYFQDKYDEAIKFYDKVLAYDSKYGQTWCNKGNALYDYGITINNKTIPNVASEIEAFDCYDRALETDFDYTMNNLVEKIHTLNFKGKDNEALIFCDKILKFDPHNNIILHLKGNILSDAGKYDEALKCFDMVFSQNNKELCYSRAYCFYKLKKYDEAMKFLDMALEIDPEYIDAIYCRGNVLFARGKYDASLNCYDKAFKNDCKKCAAILNNEGFTLANQGNFEEALKFFDKILSYDEKNTEAWCNRGYTFYLQDKWDESLDSYGESLKIDTSYTVNI